MDPQALSNTIWSFATLGMTPGFKARAALEAAVVRVGPGMDPQALSNTVWSYATLGLTPGAEARAALEAAVARAGPGMNAQEVANSLWGVATLGMMPGAEARTALEAAVVRVGSGMVPQALSNTIWSYATLGLMPGAEAQVALEAALVRVGPGMDPQHVSNLLWSVATLGLTPGAEAWAALEAAAARVAPRMNAQEVANTLWSFLILAATRGFLLPACYPSLWRAARGFDIGSLPDVALRNLFHAYLIHNELISGDMLGEVTFPPWIMHEARGAWMRNARDDVKVSNWVKEAATFLDELGVPHEVERLTDDGYFSVDVYMPGADVALEFDGPSHFSNISDGCEGAAPGDASRTPTRTVRTELRDMFLKRRHHAVVSVPWFEWAELNCKGSTDKKEFVAAKLRDAGVRIPASV